MPLTEFQRTLLALLVDCRRHSRGVLPLFEDVQLDPRGRRTDVEVDGISLAWARHWQVRYAIQGGRSGDKETPAY